MRIQEKIISIRPTIPHLIKSMSLVLLVGFIGFLIPFTRSVFSHMTPVIVILGSLVLLWFRSGERKNGFYAWTAIVFVSGFFLEVAGVNTGLIFGDYSYGKVLGLKVFGAPLLLGVNWFLVSYASIGAIEEMDTPMWIRIPLTGVLITAFDIVLEPVAVGLGMWEWSGGGVPFQNYFAWFIIGSIFTSLYHAFGLKSYNASSGPVYLSMFMFFMLMNVVFLF